MSNARVEVWLDLSDPESLFTLVDLEGGLTRTGAEAVVHPFDVAALREKLGSDPAPPSPVKADHARRDFARRARMRDLAWAGVEAPAELGAATAALAACPADQSFALALRLLRATFCDGIDLGVPAALSALVGGVPPEAPPRDLTERAAAAGVVSSPNFRVGERVLLGARRLERLERTLGGTPPEAAPVGDGPAVDVWFDYSSPYAYVGVHRAVVALGPRARLRPMLLGGVFKTLGVPMVPIARCSEPERELLLEDMALEAEAAGLPFRFPTKFPINSVTPLRMTLAAEAHETPEGWRLVDRIFRAYWSEGQDISDPGTLVALAEQVGFDGDGLLERAGTPEVKAQLVRAGEAAVAAGVFGAPTFVVPGPDGASSLYWGSDRLGLALAAASGDDRAR